MVSQNTATANISLHNVTVSLDRPHFFPFLAGLEIRCSLLIFPNITYHNKWQPFKKMQCMSMRSTGYFVVRANLWTTWYLNSVPAEPISIIAIYSFSCNLVNHSSQTNYLCSVYTVGEISLQLSAPFVMLYDFYTNVSLWFKIISMGSFLSNSFLNFQCDASFSYSWYFWKY